MGTVTKKSRASPRVSTREVGSASNSSSSTSLHTLLSLNRSARANIMQKIPKRPQVCVELLSADESAGVLRFRRKPRLVGLQRRNKRRAAHKNNRVTSDSVQSARIQRRIRRNTARATAEIFKRARSSQSSANSNAEKTAHTHANVLLPLFPPLFPQFTNLNPEKTGFIGFKIRRLHSAFQVWRVGLPKKRRIFIASAPREAIVPTEAREPQILRTSR